MVYLYLDTRLIYFRRIRIGIYISTNGKGFFEMDFGLGRISSGVLGGYRNVGLSPFWLMIFITRIYFTFWSSNTTGEHNNVYYYRHS